MKINKKLVEKLKLRLAIVCIVALGTVGIGLTVGAFSSEQAPGKVIENIVNYYEAENSVPAEAEEIVLGAMHSGNPQCFGDECFYYLTASFQDATTTFVSVADPFLTVSSTGVAMEVLRDDGYTEWLGATSTVENATIVITGVNTSSFSFKCGVSDIKTATSTYFLIESAKVPTSTQAFVSNNLYDVGGAQIAASTTPKVLLTPNYPYFTCAAQFADTTDSKSMTQTGNTFDGKVYLRVSRPRY